MSAPFDGLPPLPPGWFTCREETSIAWEGPRLVCDQPPSAWDLAPFLCIACWLVLFRRTKPA